MDFFRRQAVEGVHLLVNLPLQGARLRASNETIKEARVLTPAEVQLLAKCEKIIGKGLKAFMPVCEALQAILDQRLYRAEYRTFDDYCLKQWGITSRHANRVLAAGAVVTNIESDQLVSSEPAAIPENEGQARPLARLAPDKQVAAARIVAKKPGKPTAKAFKDAADEVSGKPKVAKPRRDTDDEDEKPRVQCYMPPTINTPTSNKPALEKLLNSVDAAEAQARFIAGCEDVTKLLSAVAKVVTQKLNGGGK